MQNAIQRCRRAPVMLLLAMAWCCGTAAAQLTVTGITPDTTFLVDREPARIYVDGIAQRDTVDVSLSFDDGVTYGQSRQVGNNGWLRMDDGRTTSAMCRVRVSNTHAAGSYRLDGFRQSEEREGTLAGADIYEPGNRIVVYWSDGTVQIRALQTLEVLAEATLARPSDPSQSSHSLGVRFMDAGRHVVVQVNERYLLVLDATTLDITGNVTFDAGSTYDGSVDPAAGRIAVWKTGAADVGLVYDPRGNEIGNMDRIVRDEEMYVIDNAVFIPGTNELLVVYARYSGGHVAVLWNYATNEQRRASEWKMNGSLMVRDDGRYIAALEAEQNRLCIVDCTTLQTVHILEYANPRSYFLSYTEHDGLVAAGNDLVQAPSPHNSSQMNVLVAGVQERLLYGVRGTRTTLVSQYSRSVARAVERDSTEILYRSPRFRMLRHVDSADRFHVRAGDVVATTDVDAAIPVYCWASNRARGMLDSVRVVLTLTRNVAVPKPPYEEFRITENEYEVLMAVPVTADSTVPAAMVAVATGISWSDSTPVRVRVRGMRTQDSMAMTYDGTLRYARDENGGARRVLGSSTRVRFGYTVPARSFTAYVNVSVRTGTEFHIVDASGRTLHIFNREALAGRSAFTFDLDMFPAGMYFVVAYCGDQVIGTNLWVGP